MPFIAFSEDVVPYWRCCFIRDWCLFISSSFKTLHISWAAADLQTLEFFNLCVCSIYCFGVFPSPFSPDAFTGSEVSTALSLMDCLSPTEFKAGSDTGEPGVCWLAQFVLIPPFLSNFGGVCRPDWFIPPPQALTWVTESGFSWCPWAHLPKLVTGWR